MSRSARTNPYPDLFAGLEEQAENVSQRVSPCDQQSGSSLASQQPASRGKVWLCLFFPSLPLQAMQHLCSADQPYAVCAVDARRSVVATNRLARSYGVLPGQPLKSALALCAGLNSVDREPALEQALLMALGQRMLAFSSLVSLQPPQALVLEVRSSLRLFGGIESLCAQLLGSLQADGYHLRHSVAPSARGAYWLARGGFSPQPEQVVQSGRAAASFLSALNALDIGVTGWDDNIISALREMGVDTLADCRRLPRAGLTRRFGTELLHSLGQAYAELPEAREAINEQQRFQAVLSLEAEISEAPRLRDACEQLLTQLEQFLRARQRAVRVLKFDFHGWHDKAGELQVSLSMAGHQRAHWQRVLSAQLERCRLSSPAVAVGLCAEASDALRAQSARLEFAEDAGSSTAASEQALHDFLDRLHARIGSQSVRALQHVAEHRPEYASRAVKAAGGVHKTGLPKDWLLHDVPAEAIDLAHNANLTLQRPLWLAMPILSLHVDAYGVVYYGGALTLQHGPERIESAWWQDESLARDYFIAENTAGVRVWVFRETHQDGGQHWWLQGVFG